MKDADHLDNKQLISSFYIPILVSKMELEDALNSKIDGTIFDDKITDDTLLIGMPIKS